MGFIQPEFLKPILAKLINCNFNSSMLEMYTYVLGYVYEQFHVTRCTYYALLLDNAPLYHIVTTVFTKIGC